MPDMEVLTINGTDYTLIDGTAMHFDWDNPVADMNRMTAYMGRVSGGTINRPNGCTLGMAFRLKHSDAFEQQYILTCTSPHRVYSRAKRDGAWSGWMYTELTSSDTTFTGA